MVSAVIRKRRLEPWPSVDRVVGISRRIMTKRAAIGEPDPDLRNATCHRISDHSVEPGDRERPTEL